MGKFNIEIKWALLFAISSLVWTAIERAAGMHEERISDYIWFSSLFAIVAIAIFVFALRDKKKNYYQGNMTWSHGFISGVIISIIITVLSPLTIYIAFTFISPDFFANMTDYNVAQGLTREKAEAYFNIKTYLLQGAFSGLSMGIVTSAVVALFLRTKRLPANDL